MLIFQNLFHMNCLNLTLKLLDIDCQPFLRRG